MNDRRTYAELLKDPRWQRVRLRVFERDGWACQECGDTKTTLNVHHRQYRRGLKPWEYNDGELVTLCRPCHYREGFLLIGIDDGEGDEHTDPSVWFRAGDGLLKEGANNGAYCWGEPDKSLPNARVSGGCGIGEFEPPFGRLTHDQRAQLVRAAIEALKLNLGTEKSK